jgi:hypothetical protein
MTSYDVFLGGSCNPTTWRTDIARQAFDTAGITYYDPQTKPVENWGDRATIERAAKEQSRIVLMVIDSSTRSIASMGEVTELICTGRDVVLVIKHIPAGLTVDGEAVGERERRDLNRYRAYLRDDLAPRYGVPVFDTVTEAVARIRSRFEPRA